MTYTPPSNFYHFINHCIHRYHLHLTFIDHDICWFTTGDQLYPITDKNTLHCLIDKAKEEEFTGFTYDHGHWSNNYRINLQELTTDEIIKEINDDIPQITKIGFTTKEQEKREER